MEIHTILGGQVRIFQRENTKKWYAATSLNGKEWKKSTKTESLGEAKDLAEDWYNELIGQKRAGVLGNAKTFEQAAKLFSEEYTAITVGRRNERWVQSHIDRIRLHLMPFFDNGKTRVDKITSGTAQEYRKWRMTEPEQNFDIPEEERKPWKPPARNTIHNEIVTLRMILKTILRHEWIKYVPDLSDPYRKESKVGHRAWFTQEEYKQLYTATRKRAQCPQRPHHKWYAEQLHDFVLFMANTGLRPDEANRLQYRDVKIVTFVENKGTKNEKKEQILEIEVNEGKTGVGYCKSMPGAVPPFRRLVERNNPQPTDLLFPNDPKKMFNNILREEGLKFDRHGNPRTAYSLRHSYICFRLLEGANIYDLSKNCRTSVEMIEKHYARHLKDMIDASRINVRRKTKSQVEEEFQVGGEKE